MSILDILRTPQRWGQQAREKYPPSKLLDLILGRGKGGVGSFPSVGITGRTPERKPKRTPSPTLEVTGPTMIESLLGKEKPEEAPKKAPVEVATIQEEVQEEVKEPASSEQITSAIKTQGGENSPLLQYSDQIIQATKDFDFFKNNPFLLPVIAHLETGGGRNITRPNNILNWGINFPGNNELFAEMTIEEVLDRAITGLGERSGIYEKFRTGKPLTDDELLAFANTYEPANEAYGPNLLRLIREMEGL